MKKTAVILAAMFLIVAAAGGASAEEVIRYKPVVVQRGDNNLYPPQVLIVDTKDGHVWLWQERGRKDAPDSAPDAQLIYQGRVSPGRSAGDVVADTRRK